MPRNYGTAHSHSWGEWEIEPDGTSVLLTQPCNYTEITGSQTSERLDETFYETGYECDAVRTTLYEPSEVYDHGESVDPRHVDPEVWSEIQDRFAEDVGMAAWDPIEPESRVRVTYGNYTVVWEQLRQSHD